MFEMIVFTLLGIAIGSVASFIFCRSRLVGTLQIIESDELGQPYIFLELNDEVETLCDKNFVYMDVKVKQQLSQK